MTKKSWEKSKRREVKSRRNRCRIQDAGKQTQMRERREGCDTLAKLIEQPVQALDHGTGCGNIGSRRFRRKQHEKRRHRLYKGFVRRPL